MDFTHDGDTMGYRGNGDNALMGIMAGSLLNKDDDKGKTSTMMIVLAVVFFVIVFIIALVFLAMAFKDKGYDRKDYGGTDIAALLTPLIAAKSMESNNCNGYKNGEIDKLEIMQKLEASEDRARQTQTQQEISTLGKEFTAMGFGLSGQIHNSEKTTIENFGKIENQLGQLTMGVGALLQDRNNDVIINGVINRLVGVPCFAGR